MPLMMIAESSEPITTAAVALTHDSWGGTGICVGMDTSVASPDRNPLLAQVVTDGESTRKGRAGSLRWRNQR